MRSWIYLGIGALLIAGVYSPWYTHPSPMFLVGCVVLAFIWLSAARLFKL